ncbi:hypothetical protein EGT50_11075 [Rhodococcus xishaensis]|uniref:Uncharacterized protein n=1 Tax=Rhodococcus xishaensis TaxID=2487364 RepID=A0A3S3AJB7_9NOCA|nr:hypothetical protein EGT50_11075 [Rhodococcus xishaensis]
MRKNEVRGLTAGLVSLTISSVAIGVANQSWTNFVLMFLVGLIFLAATLVAVRLLASPKR